MHAASAVWQGGNSARFHLSTDLAPISQAVRPLANAESGSGQPVSTMSCPKERGDSGESGLPYVGSGDAEICVCIPRIGDIAQHDSC